MSTVGNINLDLGINTRSFDRQIDNIGRSVQRRTGTLSVAIGNVIANFATRAIEKVVGFAGECVKVGSDLSELDNVTDTVFTHMADKVNEFSKNALDMYGLNEAQAKKMVGTFGAMSKSFGYTEEQAYDMSTALTALAGDVASFYNLRVDEAYTKLKSVYTGETESLKELGVVMTQAALDQYALSNGFGKTTKQMTEQEKVALRLAFVQDKLSVASGDVIRTSDSWANQTRKLSGQIESLKAQIGQGLIYALTPVIKVINTIIGKLVQLASAFNSFMASLFGKKSSSSGGQVLGEVADAANMAADSVGGVGDAAEATGKSAEKAAQKLMGFDEVNNLSDDSSSGSGGGGGAAFDSLDLSKPVNDLTSMTNQASILSQAMQGIVDFGNRVWNKFWQDSGKFITKHLDSIKTSANNIVKHFKDFGSAVWDIFTGVFGSNTFSDLIANWIGMCASGFVGALDIFGKLADDIVDVIVTPLIDNKDKVKDAMLNILNPIKDILGTLRKGVQDTIDNILKMYDAHLKPFFESVKNGFSELCGKILDGFNKYIAPVLDEWANKFDDLWNNTLQPIINDIIDIFGGLVDIVKVLWENILKPFIGWIIDTFGPLFGDTFKVAGDVIFGVFNVLGGVIKGFTQSIKGIVDFIAGTFTGNWRRAWNGVKDIFSGVFNALYSIAKAPLNGIIGLVNGVIRGLNRIKIPSIDIPFFGKVGGWGFNLSQIPYLAKGGIVDSPTLAMIGEAGKEAVVPLEHNTALVDKLSGQIATGMMAALNLSKQGTTGNDMEAQIVLDGEVCGRLLTKYINKDNSTRSTTAKVSIC